MKIDLMKQQNWPHCQYQVQKAMLSPPKARQSHQMGSRVRRSPSMNPNYSQQTPPFIVSVRFMVWDTAVANSGQLPWLTLNCYCPTAHGWPTILAQKIRTPYKHPIISEPLHTHNCISSSAQLNVYFCLCVCFVIRAISSSLCFHTERELTQAGSTSALFFSCAFFPNEGYQIWQPWRLKSFVCRKGLVLSARGWNFTFTLFQQYVSINNALTNFQEPPAEVKGMSNIKG